MSKKSQQERAERSAAVLREQQQRERRRQVLIVVGVLVAIVAIVAAGFLVNSMRDSSNKVAEKAPPAGASEFGVTIGTDTAPHTVVIYEDFLCPYCGELERKTHEQLAALAVDGSVFVEYRPFELLKPAGTYSKRSAGAFSIVLDAAGPEVAKKFHDLLYADQPSEQGPFPSNGDLVDLAVQAGADENAVRAAIEGEQGADWVDAATNSADDAGVIGTPTILVDGELFTKGRTIDDLAANLLAVVQ